jgi:hypothetical protein
VPETRVLLGGEVSGIEYNENGMMITWGKEGVKTRISCKVNRGSEKMARIEYYVKPLRLYRYRSLNNGKFDRELNAIKASYLWCSAYMDLNDPMEGSFSSSKLLRQSARYREIKNAIIDNKAAIRMSSFSEVFDHELMWAHYADQFKGICIGYSLRKLLENLGNEIEFVRMFYSEKVPLVSYSTNDPVTLAKMVLSYKNYRWLYEREWRMFANRGRTDYFKESCVTHVYLGARMNPEYRNRLIAELTPLGIKTSEMSVDKYSIKFSRLRH